MDVLQCFGELFCRTCGAIYKVGVERCWVGRQGKGKSPTLPIIHLKEIYQPRPRKHIVIQYLCWEILCAYTLWSFKQVWVSLRSGPSSLHWLYESLGFSSRGEEKTYRIWTLILVEVGSSLWCWYSYIIVYIRANLVAGMLHIYKYKHKHKHKCT